MISRAHERGVSARPLRVLLIEDDADGRSVLLRDLQRAGFAPDVERVQDPEGMAAALRRADFEIVIAEYRLPRFSAPEALLGSDALAQAVRKALAEE
jgi:DNA-binding NtrC family response regulator